MQKNKKKNLLMLLALFLTCGVIGTVSAVGGGTGGQFGGGSGNLGGSSSNYYDCGDVKNNEAYKMELVYKPKNGNRYTIASAVVWAGVWSDYKDAVESYVSAGNTTYKSLIYSGPLKDLANKLKSGVTVEQLTSEGWLDKHLPIETWAPQLGVSIKELSLPHDENPGRMESYGYRLLIQKMTYFCKTGGGNAIPRKELAQSGYATANGEGDFMGTGHPGSYQGDIATFKSDIGIKSGWNEANTRANFADPNNGKGYNIVWVPNKYGTAKNYSIDAACENCTSTLSTDKGSYIIQDTTNWDAIKDSSDNDNKNVKKHYKKADDIYCREEYKVSFPNATNIIQIQNGSYFTAGLKAPQNMHPNFAPIEVTRTMQCQSKSGNSGKLQNFMNSSTLKSAGSVSVHYVEGESVNRLVSIGSENSSYNSKDKTYRIDSGSVSSSPNDNDYTIKLKGSGGNADNTIRENKGDVKKTISGGTLTMSLTSQYLLPENLYRYINKNIKSEYSKPKDNLDSYIDAGVPNLPVSLQKKNTKYENMSAFIKLVYDFPTDNSYMKDAWNAKTQADYFGSDNVNPDSNIYNTSVEGESEGQTACAKLYGLGTSEYNKCKNDRKSGSKIGNCKNVNSDEYVCPIKTYTECVKKSGKCYVDGKETDCASVNTGQCVVDTGKKDCKRISSDQCQIIENGKVTETGNCSKYEDLYGEKCPYDGDPDERCVSIDDYKSCEIHKLNPATGKWYFVESGDCKAYTKKYSYCKQGTPVPDCPPGENCPNGIDVIYRPIDLIKSFPGMSGVGRNSGSNWCSIDRSGNSQCTQDTSRTIEAAINMNRGVPNETVYNHNQGAIYTFDLDGTKIKQIKTYNKGKSYSAFDLSCKKDGTACLSEFVATYASGGSCKNSGKDDFYTCKYGGYGNQ